MTKELEKQLRTYYAEIRKKLICNKQTKSNFISTLKNRIDEYIEDNANATYDDIVEEFGTPDSIANDFHSKEDVDTLSKKTKRFPIIIAVCTIVFLLIVSILIYIVKETINGADITVTNSYDSIEREYDNSTNNIEIAIEIN